MRLRGSPTMEPVDNDVEADIERRCSWWSSNPSALRARSKPWQLAPASVNLGLRCCCDHAHDPIRCVRVRSKKAEQATHSARYEATLTVNANWRGHCPPIDFGRGKVRTHHDPLGCTLPMLETSFGRCCCVKRKDLPPQFRLEGTDTQGGRVAAGAAKPDYLCKQIGDEQRLHLGAFCPNFCVLPANRSGHVSCVNVQSHHVPGACES